jgi:S-DNA-T family DNA segregation ATPase FtsK/SpoIIIE
MAKKRGKSRESVGRPLWWRVLRFFFVPPGLYLTLTVIVAAIVSWQWGNIVDWVTSVVDKTWALFGWGLLLAFLFVVALVVAIASRRFAARHLLYWLGSLAFIAALWGLLAFFDLGGNIGLGIIRDTNFLGVLILVGITVLGIILVAPRACFRLVADFASWVGERFRRRPPVEGVSRPKVSIPPIRLPRKAPPAEPGQEAVAPAPAPPPTQQELKQVAQEVWKKYGESPSVVTVDGWRLPPIDILDKSPEIQFSQADNMQRAKLIEEALGSYGVEAKVVQINTGPTVTQFGVEPGWDRRVREIKERDKEGRIRIRQEEVARTRVKVERINSLANDLALALAAPTIRIEAPIPGQSVVGIEVPNSVSSVVSLRGVIETSAFQKSESKSKLSLSLGKGAGGEAVAADLARMPHLLIAGATGSGKTVCLNTVICCLLMYNTPDEVRFILIDPKRVELVAFNSLPHLAAPVIVDTDRALEALRWLNQEMDRRYQKLAMMGVRSIEGYNKNRQGDQKMPYLVLIIDELADLMMAGGDEVERILCRLAQLARAVGIHLVVATQRPSVDVVTGLIKANFPTRISFAVTSQVDSRTILDGAGAEKLLGRGDMLYMPTEAAKPKRLQGSFVSDPEIERLVYFWSGQKKQEAALLRVEDLVAAQPVQKGVVPEDPYMEQARLLAAEHPKFSVSYLQRKLRIGYPRAARIADQLEQEGYGEKTEEGEPPA